MVNKKFPSKVLLFGEYTVLHGGKALAVPVRKFSGTLQFEKKRSLDKNFQSLHQYLQGDHGLTSILDFALFEKELHEGLYFNSDIPIGYGMGSSGALIAAIYDRYALDPIQSESELRVIFSKMESFFHGASSGFDPLVSYLKTPILVLQDTVKQIPFFWPDDYDIYLIDSRGPRETSKFVHIFLDKFSGKHQREHLSETLAKWNDQIIDSLIEKQHGELISLLKRISLFQLNQFKEMIPSNITKLWELGCEDQNFTIKLCGAGGGGFFLGICEKGLDFTMFTQLNTVKLDLNVQIEDS